MKNLAYTWPVRWLALDVGAKRVGVALADPSETVVTPQRALAGGAPQLLAARIKALVELWGVEGVVVGLPVTQGGKSRGEARVRALLEALRAVLEIPVVPWDERGTTQEAAARLAELGLSAAAKRRAVDAVAAAVLLESFLAARKRQKAAGNAEG